VTLTFRYPRECLNGFGCLFPEKEKFYSLGVLSNTDIFEQRGPFYTETWILGGALNSNIAILKDADILNEILKDRQRLLETTQKPDEWFIQRYEKAVPHYDLKLEKILDELKHQSAEDLFLTGNYLGHLGLAKIYDSNILLAEKIAQLYRGKDD
jgi:protoporphyrinogen oxidase